MREKKSSYPHPVRWTVTMSDGTKCEQVASSSMRAMQIAEIMSTKKAVSAEYDGER